MDWLDLFAVQGNNRVPWTLKSLLQHHSSKASILQHSAFFTVQLSHPYMTNGKTIALTRWAFVGKEMSLLFNMLPRFVIAYLPRRSSVQSLSRFLLFATPWIGVPRLHCPSPSPRAYSNSCPLSHWVSHSTISSSVDPFSSCLQSFPASRSFQMH